LFVGQAGDELEALPCPQLWGWGGGGGDSGEFTEAADNMTRTILQFIF
jgi:hypothetical protein